MVGVHCPFPYRQGTSRQKADHKQPRYHSVGSALNPERFREALSGFKQETKFYYRKITLEKYNVLIGS